MSDTITPPGFTLDHAVTMGDGTVIHAAGTRIMVRKPDAGELRGTKLTDLIQNDVTALLTIAPRITSPAIPKGAKVDPADLMQFGGEVIDFLLPKDVKADLPTT